MLLTYHMALMQALWAMAALVRSKQKERREAASSILSHASKTHRRLFQHFTSFMDHMVALCNAQPTSKSRSGFVTSSAANAAQGAHLSYQHF